MITFNESKMTFGPFPPDMCFLIEKSGTYTAIQQGPKIAEFVLRRDRQNNPTLYIIEAKSSSPQPRNQKDFEGFIVEIRDKLANTLELIIASMLGRHPQLSGEPPAGFSGLPLQTTSFGLVLIINGHKKEWLPPLQDALRIALQKTEKLWALGPNSISVINHETAKLLKFIS
ncbi:MAG: hypothetical protein ACAI35_00515 [Candidatus Methylacidiphilales bacterium]|nr:hypothetical protein [Candidatus Methylacidiphilales bacterium]